MRHSRTLAGMGLHLSSRSNPSFHRPDRYRPGHRACPQSSRRMNREKETEMSPSPRAKPRGRCSPLIGSLVLRCLSSVPLRTLRGMGDLICCILLVPMVSFPRFVFHSESGWFGYLYSRFLSLSYSPSEYLLRGHFRSIRRQLLLRRTLRSLPRFSRRIRLPLFLDCQPVSLRPRRLLRYR